MKSRYLLIFVLFTSLFCKSDTVYLVPIQGDIDMGLPYFIERAIVAAESDDADVIIFDIDTFGGRVDAATQIKDHILGSTIPTIAFINRRAISAGALISLSCDSIFMTSGATIGAATAVDLQGNKGSEKVISYMREEMASTAEANGKSRDIAAMMVDEELTSEFVLSANGDTLTQLDIEGLKPEKLITLTTKNAIKVGFADGEFETVESIMQHLNLGDADLIEITPSWSEKIVRFLTKPAVAPLLMTLGFLGLLFEVKSPGIGVPGIAGIIFLALFFGSHLLVGLADMVEILMLIGGILLIFLEIFVFPGCGIAGIGGGALVLWSLFKMLLGEYPNPEDFQNAYLGLSIGIVGAIIGGIVIFKAITQSDFYSKIIQFKPQRKEEGYTISKGYEKLIGENGIAQTDLRPTGKALIKKNIYQVMSTGDYIENGSSISVVGVDENQLIVAKASPDATKV